MTMNGRISFVSSSPTPFPEKAAERRCRGLRETAPPSPVMVYRAKKHNGEFISEPDYKRGLMRIETVPQFTPLFNPDFSKK